MSLDNASIRLDFSWIVFEDKMVFTYLLSIFVFHSLLFLLSKSFAYSVLLTIIYPMFCFDFFLIEKQVVISLFSFHGFVMFSLQQDFYLYQVYDLSSNSVVAANVACSLSNWFITWSLSVGEILSLCCIVIYSGLQ